MMACLAIPPWGVFLDVASSKHYVECRERVQQLCYIRRPGTLWAAGSRGSSCLWSLEQSAKAPSQFLNLIGIDLAIAAAQDPGDARRI